MKPKVVISLTSDKYESNVELTVTLDGKVIGKGSYGGAPEDNREYRTYSWVRPLLGDLAKALGADVDSKGPWT